MKNADRRCCKRFPVQPVLCKTLPRINGVCVLRNVSLSGAYFLHASPPPVGSKVRMEFSEPPLEGYQLNAKVVRHMVGKFQGFAVNFTFPKPRLLRAVYCNEYPD